MNWSPTKEPSAQEVPLEDGDSFIRRATGILHRDLAGTAYVSQEDLGSYSESDLCIYRCLIHNETDATDAVWIYVENQSDGQFSTYFLF